MKSELNIGMVGAGGFAGFASKSFKKVPGIHIVAVTDIHEPAARQLGLELNAAVYPDLDGMLADPRIDLIYIATPPFLHYQQSRKALFAGKHVICEKPAALKTREAEELAEYARAHGLLYAVNLMQRYNPLYLVVQTIIREKWLGDFLHGFFENYASDEKLNPEHWFWDEAKSGGIFIEHGVHFFDLFSGWLGEGKLVHSMQIQRPGADDMVIDRVQATVMYPNGPVNFYHGFNQPKALDRQEMRLQFDRGDITLYEWVPVRIRLHGLLTTETLDHLKRMLPDCTIAYESDISLGRQTAKGKFTDMEFDAVVTLESGHLSQKMDRYEQLVISMIRDQWSWIQDHNHQRLIDENNAVASLRIAEAATDMAQHF
jgi:predicted dehydrogenase